MRGSEGWRVKNFLHSGVLHLGVHASVLHVGVHASVLHVGVHASVLHVGVHAGVLHVGVLHIKALGILQPPPCTIGMADMAAPSRPTWGDDSRRQPPYVTPRR